MSRSGRPVLSFEGGRLRSGRRPLVEERPLTLTVNGKVLATLIASPHDPADLAAGFLRMQGLVARREDILVLGVCPDSGTATIRIRGEVPGTLVPVVTSGCGGGLSFSLPGDFPGTAAGRGGPNPREPFGDVPAGGDAGPRDGSFSPRDVFDVMDALARRADLYRESGGIHSAAAGFGGPLLLVAEDIGRHNAIDRIAGRALLEGIDLSGSILATSGRVSSEMAAKGAALGAVLIASRTSPTDLAARICEERGITLVGYVRGRRFTVYTHPWRIRADREDRIVPGVTGVILAGGSSRRMGRPKALLPFEGGALIEAVYRRMAGLFRDVVVVADDHGPLDFLPCPKVPDLYRGRGSLAGIHAGLRAARTEHVFVAACDMPLLDGDLVRHLASLREGYDAVVPESDAGPEPLCAVYGKGALAAVEEALGADRRRIADLLPRIRTRTVPREEVARFDPGYRSFRNINTPDEYGALLAGNPPGRGPGGAFLPKALTFVAPSGTGKTTLLAKVIARLVDRGYRVGAIKHGAHGFDIDHPGKDSHRLAAAGANPTVITSPDRLALVLRHDAEPPVEEILSASFGSVDVVLAEGFKGSGLGKIEVHRKGAGGDLLCRGAAFDPALVAVASDEPLDVDVPVLDIDDPGAVADFIEKVLGLSRPRSGAVPSP